ncbi:MAG: hypothetical protein QOD76_1626 [Solirubrobacteraceae bacterium]|nr:hypothetical protein [Solirubrobacteraceae bacterium]
MAIKKRGYGEPYFRALLDTCSEGLIVVDPSGTITDATSTFRETWAGGQETLAGTSLTTILHPEDGPDALTLCANAAHSVTKSGPVRWRVRHRNGSWHDVEAVVHNLLDNPAVRSLVVGIRDIAPVSALEERLRDGAFRDALTGLGNRVVLFDRSRIALSRQRPGAWTALLFIDIDDFKAVNDSWGHAAGDELLVGMSERVLGCLRPEDVAARLGGDEFAVLLEGLTSPEQAGEVAQRIIEAFREPFTVGDSLVRVQTSIGIVATEPGRRRPEELLRDADVAMYAAKSRGKGRFEYFDHDMRVGAIERLELKDSLQRAIDDGEFLLHYQPMVELRTGQIIGAEALLRWRDRDRGMIPPAKFIGLAEEAGMMDTIGRWVLREACRTAQRFQDPDGRPFRISVNLSPRQIDQPGLADEVAETLSDTHVKPSNLVIEITEQIFMQDSPHVAVNLRKLKEMGVCLAIDDFGTGYSSLSYLQRFPVDFLKIDKSFVDLLGDGTDKPVLAGAIIQIAHSLGLKVVAEGIELPEQLAHLRELNCDYGQGFLFAKPLESQNMAKYWRLAEVQTVAPRGADDPALTEAKTVAQPASG